MQFTKNKTTNQLKLVLTTSALILNGNMCGFFNSSQKDLNQNAANRSIMARSKDMEVKHKLDDLEDGCNRLKHC